MKEKVTYTNLNVAKDNRIHIPKDALERFDIGENGFIELRLPEYDEQFGRYMSGKRVTIPARIRKRHDIGPDDELDVEIIAQDDA